MADAVLITRTDETDLSRNHAKSLSKINPALSHINPDQLRPVEYLVGLYSTSKRRMPESNLAFIIENAHFKTVSVPTCPADERYIKVMDIPHPLQSVEMDPNDWPNTIVRVANAGRVAMSICHPDIISDNMDHLPPQSTLQKVAISSGCDYIRQGLFFTRAEEGSKEFKKALGAAEARRDAFYRGSLDGLLGMSDQDIQRALAGDRGLDLRTAAAHFGEDIPGMRSRSVKMDCPNCFEKIPQGAAYHRNELLGLICVIDWKRAVEAGVKKLEDVPASKLWDSAKKKP